MEEEASLLAGENSVPSDHEKEEKKERGKEEEESDPIIEAIGEFGRYQLLVCVVGFFMNIPHSWLSLR